MKHFLRIGGLLTMVLMMSACKLAVIVVEGGEVQSSSSGTCSAGMVCVNQVNDTTYAETYIAVPASGWRFEKWNSGGDFLCAESTIPQCLVSNVEFAGYEAVEDIVASNATFYIMPIFTEIAVRPDYDPERSDYDGGVDASMLNRVYWSTTFEPPSADSDQWFDVSVNRCASSYSALDLAGFYSSQGTRRWRNSSTGTSCVSVCSADGSEAVSGVDVLNCIYNLGGSVVQNCTPTLSPGVWTSLATFENNPIHVDCEEDVINTEPGNGSGQPNGYPKSNVDDADVYSAATPAESNVDWGNQSYALYSANFIDYWNDPSP